MTTRTDYEKRMNEDRPPNTYPICPDGPRLRPFRDSLATWFEETLKTLTLEEVVQLLMSQLSERIAFSPPDVAARLRGRLHGTANSSRGLYPTPNAEDFGYAYASLPELARVNLADNLNAAGEPIIEIVTDPQLLAILDEDPSVVTRGRGKSAECPICVRVWQAAIPETET